MTREEKCLLAIEKGYIYNPETGSVIGPHGRLLSSTNYSGYLMISLTLDNKTYNLRQHQFAWYWVNREIGDSIDHINRIKSDNRIINLRSVTHKENTQNKYFKGYYYHKRDNNWNVYIKVDNKRKYLASFKTEKDAIVYYGNL